MALTVPKSTHVGLRGLATADEKTVESLYSILQEASPAGDAYTLASSVASRYSAQLFGQVREIVRSLVAMHTGRVLLGLDVSDFVDEVCEGLQGTQAFDQIADRIDTSLRNRLRNFLLLKGALAVTSKATSIRTDHEHLFVDVRVLTDIRSVFGDDATEAPVAAVITHMLALHYHDGAEHKEMFFALDAEGLKQMTDALERARQKANTLQDVLAKAGIPCLGDE